MTQTLAHEAWCPSCRVTHPPGTRRCVHCGGTVLAERPATSGGVATRLAREGAAAPWPIDPESASGESDEAAGKARAARPMKFGMAALWVVIAIVTGILRACSERG